MDYRLNEEEITVINAWIHAGNMVYDKDEDKYLTMSEEELKEKIQNVKSSLLQKEYMAMDFDGKTEVTEEVKQLIRDCSDSERIIAFSKTESGKNLRQFFYGVSDTWIKAVEENDDYIFTNHQEPVKNLLWESIALEEKTEDQKYIFQIEQEKLEHIQNLVVSNNHSQAEKELKEAGCDDQMCDLILAAIGRKGAFYSLLFVDKRNQVEPITDVMFFQGEKLLFIESVISQEFLYVEFQIAEKKDIEGYIAAELQKLINK